MEKIIAMVPIKLNNERLPNKNIKILGNKPLVQYILNTLKAIKNIDDIYVFCSDESIIPYLPSGVIFLKRDKELDLPSANFTQFFDAFAKMVDADIYVFSHATAPFIENETIQKCISKVLNEGYDSAFSATRIQDFLWKNQEPLNFDASNIPRTQDIEPIYRETSGIYVFKRDVFKKDKRRIGKTPYIAEISWKEAIDINTYEDFEIAKLVVGNHYTTPKNIIFDLDGCIIDSERVQRYAFEMSYAEVVGDDKCPSFEEFMKHTGNSLHNIFKMMDLPLEMIEPYRRISNSCINMITINEELISWIRKMREKQINFAICTGKDRERTIEILNFFNVTDLFNTIVCSDDVKNPKPSAEPTMLAMKNLSANQDDSVLVGDGYNDILSAKNAGVRSILALWYGDANVPEDEADFVAHSVGEFESILNGLL